MLILAATNDTQGQRKSDFNWCEEGEPVMLGFECDHDKNQIDGGCGCRRSWSGLKSGKAGTTCKVIESDIDVKALIVDHYVTGWHFTPEEAEDMASEDMKELTKIAEFFKLGAVIEKRGSKFQRRANA